MDFFYQGHWRLDWGFGNPNKTAVLIACLLVAVWGLGRLNRGGFWLALGLFTGLSVCLIHTYSRGGLVAALAGQATWWILEGRKHLGSNRARWGALLFAVLALSGYAHLGSVEAAGRWSAGIGPGSEPDASIANRLTMWRLAPRMMLDAPGGWGHGRSGEAYMHWYQESGTRYFYRTLVNSHLTRLVEWGHGLRFAYLWGWGAILWIAWPGGERRAGALPLACWVAFGTGGLFSTVDEAWILWSLPTALLVWAIFDRARTGDWAGWRPGLACSALAAGAILAALLIAGYQTGTPVPIRHRGGVTTIGSPSSVGSVALVEPDRQILGTHYGITLRTWLAREERSATWHVAPSLRHLQRSGLEPDLLVHAGRVAPDLPDTPSPIRNLVLNPRSAADLDPLKEARHPSRPILIVGASRADTLARLLQKRGDELGWVIIASPGNRWFLPDWPHEIEKAIQSNP